MLKQRVLSAVIGVPLILGAVYGGGIWYFALIFLLANVGLYEYLGVYRSGGFNLPATGAYFGVNALLVLVYAGRTDLIYPAIIVLFLILGLGALLRFGKRSTLESALVLWGIIYLGGLGGYLILLRSLPEGISMTVMLFLIVWSYDIFAYFIGKRWGRRPLAPRISPQKSVEGALGGLAAALLVAAAVVSLWPRFLVPLTVGPALLLALGVALLAQCGDLLESALKRQTQIKDSGQLIPGHGGVLDRFDSLLLAAPFAYYFFLIIYR